MWTRRGRAPAPSESPRLSVVVPVHGVAEYLPACLASIAAQPLTDHEVIVVDDGSPDGSARIVEKLMRRDGRVRLLRQENAGLGAARNAGVAQARGTMLAFVDGDDELPPDAWTAMLKSLLATGSDFAVGTAERDDGTRRWTTPLMKRNHEQQRLAISIGDAPLMLADVFAWNKVYRRDFWARADLSFPVSIRYEDQPALTRAFLAAEAFDVLTETVYWWRVREDQSSITQKRHEIGDLEDRLVTKRDSAKQVRDHGNPDVIRVFHQEVLPVDMWEYFRAVPRCTDEYWRLLVEGVREFWTEETVRFEATAVPPQQRLMGWLVQGDRRNDLEAFLGWLDSNRPLPFEGGELVHPWRGEPVIPRFAKL
jgi:glycosyltransferase involved in cell wall biosynthesis